MRGAIEHACQSCGVVVQLDWATAHWRCNDCIQSSDEDEHYVDSSINWEQAIQSDRTEPRPYGGVQCPEPELKITKDHPIQDVI